jgi:hypothetical protein
MNEAIRMTLLSAQATDTAAVTVGTADLAAVVEQLTEAAAFLDAMAGRLDSWMTIKAIEHAAADCRAMAKKLRGET